MNKTALYLVIALLFTFQAHSQVYWQWEDPIPLTDSLSNNINPYLFYNGGFHMVWEKEIDSLTSSVWYVDLATNNPGLEILHSPGVLHKNPKILDLGNLEFYVIYETNEPGNWDIWCISYLGGSSFSDPFPFADSDEDERDFNVGNDGVWQSSYINSITWVKDSSVYVTNLLNNYQFSDPVLIDSGGCHHPYLSYSTQTVVYEKAVQDENHIYICEKETISVWGEPDTLYDENHCMNLSADRVGNWLFTWSVFTDSIWKIAAFEPFDYNTHLFDQSSSTPLSPAITYYFTPLKEKTDLYSEFYLAYPFFTEGYNEIFLNQETWEPYQFDNFTNWGRNNRNPGFFIGPDELPYCHGIFLVWESFVNGYWQIYSAKTLQCWGSVDENNLKKSFMSSHPNPFTHETNLGFTLDSRSDVLIEVYDTKGERVGIITNQLMAPGAHQLRWNAGSLPVGIYIIKLTTENKTYSTKLIKAD